MFPSPMLARTRQGLCMYRDTAGADTESAFQEYLSRMLKWHFDETTGSPFWVKYRERLGFDPVSDVHTFDELSRFPSRINALRDVRIEELIPRGLAEEPVPQVVESGGTTGRPKRAIVSQVQFESMVDRYRGYAPEASGQNMLSLLPSGPHQVGNWHRKLASSLRVLFFQVDFDPRWVKSGISSEAQAEYTSHVLAQAKHVLLTQGIGHLLVTPPLLRRIAESPDLRDLVRSSVQLITWGGAHLTREDLYEYSQLIFPEVNFVGTYASSITGTRAFYRRSTPVDEAPVFDPVGPELFVRVVDSATRQPVRYRARGQVLMHTITRDMFLPNNLERDWAVRVPGDGDWRGDSLSDVVPMSEFEGARVIEGIY